LGQDGNIHSAPADIADDLRHEWENVFRARPTDERLRAEWLDDDLPPLCTSLPSPSSSRWRPSRASTKKAIDRAGKSATGPDGIPASAYRALGNLGIDVLHSALAALSASAGKEDMMAHILSFNESLTHFIPKKVIHHGGAQGDCYFGG